MEQNKSIRITIRLELERFEKFMKAVKKYKTTKSRMLRYILDEFLSKGEGK